ncbi:hypothetical protein [Streptomyces sp. S.PNR 29]|uniref:hypothetical protein n=1 Tax=Streptomyces sp. S.PNR 29 TaxID=2973805 RepID=UPI0025AF826E|nr:hypothetical protein [Streptomyces sp. S.PNR 29]MDN0198099.1 hypothetical protein [Streptomyces sp. S.PNR 29]
MIADITVTNFPPVDSLPRNVAELIAARDAVYEELDAFEVEWADVLADDWRTIAEGKDIRSAVDAARAGKDGLKGASEVAKARDIRPRVVGVHRVLTSKLREAENAAQKAFRAVVGTLEADALKQLRETAQRAEEAYRAYLAARDALGGAANRVRFVRDWQSDGRPSWTDEGMNPLRADNSPLTATEPLAEIRELLESFNAPFTPDPLVWVEFGNGQRMELRRSQAKALNDSANNDIRLVDAE